MKLYIFSFVFYNLATSRLCICKFVTLFPFSLVFFVVEDSSGRETVSNRGSTSLPLVSTIVVCTLPCKDLRVTRRGIAACTCLHHGGGQRRKRRDAAFIRNIYAECSCPRARAVLLRVSMLAVSLSLSDQVVRHL